MAEYPTLVPQRGVERVYEMVKNRLWGSEFSGLDDKAVTEKMHLINVAYDLAKLAHRNQIRDSGEDYFKNHVLPVLTIYLDELRGDNLEGALTCLFHDCPEDTERVDTYVIQKVIGAQVAENVAYLTKPGYEVYLDHEQREAYDVLSTDEERIAFLKPLKKKIKPLLVEDYFVKMKLSANDTTVEVKAADRLHNLRSLPDDLHWIQDYVCETEKYILPILKQRKMNYAAELINRELVKLKLRIQTLTSQNLLKDALN